MKRSYKFTIILLLLIVIMSAVIIWSFFRGTKLEESDGSPLSGASIPTLTMEYNGHPFNCLQGYTARLDNTAVDTVLTPLGPGGKLDILIGKTEEKITDIEYSVFRQKDSGLVEERRIEGPAVSVDGAKTTLDMSRSVEGNQQYILEIRLNMDQKGPIYYYTRVVRSTDIDVEEALTFVSDFCKNTFDKKANDKITTYIEPDATGNNTTLQYVNIHSSYDQVTWGDLDMQMIGEPVFNLLEVNGKGAVLSVDYQTVLSEDEETNSYYLVHEYYRVRRSELRMHLLEFERELTQTFLGTQLSFTGQSVMLGILPEDVEYVYDKENDYVCWEQAGELWLYQTEGNRLYKIFSMQDTVRGDKRSFMQNYDIDILTMDRDGNIDFVVSGYCNRGNYEGKVCVQLCHYTKRNNSYEVRYVMEDNRSEALLCQDMSQLTYLRGNYFYYYSRGALRRLDIAGGEVTDLIEDLKTGTFAVSDDNRYLSWVEDPDHSDKICRMDLADEKVSEIQSDEGEYLRPIGYVGQDFAYGKAKADAVRPGVAGELWFPMYSVVICDKNGDVIKEYTDESLPVISGETTKDMIMLHRVSPASGGTDYIAAQPHQIVSSERQQEAVSLETVSSDNRQTRVQLKFQKGHTVPAVHVYTAKEKGYFESIEMEADAGRSEDCFYVYQRGRLSARFCLSRDAFVYAAENGGVIKDARLVTLFYRSIQSREYSAAGIPQFPVAILKEQGAEEYPGIAAAWRQASQETVLDATGVPLDTAKSIAAWGDQVLVRVGEASYVLLTGFTDTEVTWYDPLTEQTSKMPADQAEAAYRQFGSVCIVNMK